MRNDDQIMADETEEKKVSSGSDVFDEFLGGGFEKGIVTTIYGPGGSGKTNLCMFPLIRMAGTGKKIVYIDSESSFSIERLKQITKYYEKVLENTLFFHPYSFEEQKKIFDQIFTLLNKNIGLVIVDTISMLYRLELGQTRDVQNLNAELVRQIAVLMRCAGEYNIPIIVTNQVYADFNDKERVNMVGGDILKNGSRCLIELEKLAGNHRRAHLRKHRSLPEQNLDFSIVEKGFEKKK